MRKEFDDFDAWGEAVRGADLRLACDGVETPVWQLTVRQLGPLTLQMAHEGGGNLCFGGNTHRGTILYMPLGDPHQHVVNCERLDDRSLLIIPPESDFCIQVRKRSHAWCSVALPENTVVPHGTASRVVRADPMHVRRLKRLVEHATQAEVMDEAPASVQAEAAHQVTTAALSCVGLQEPCPALVGRPRVDRTDVVRRVVAVLDGDPLGHRSIADLASSVGVHPRTLSRVFHDTYGVAPRQFVRLRTLHAVRRSLRDGDPGQDTVARILARHGVWELGRFAGLYRRQFGETPSHTLRRP
ncbi:MAG: helix-turn-helix domain-containing protein [Planctomycetia bacterium]|nr:helix-turn-helix domain-containing protein [Planctomycetia bacterium]